MGDRIPGDDLLLFFGGLVFGMWVSYRWSERSKRNAAKSEKETEIEHDFVAGSEIGNNKLILVVRNDLKMGKGKVAAQCSHAAVMAHESCRLKQPQIFTDWKNSGQPKIVVKIEGEKEMMDLAVKARNSKLVVSIVSDAGRTQVASGTRTVLAIGPGPNHVIDQLTGHLKLY